VTSPLLSITDLVVSFDGFRAVDGVTLSVDRGELRFLIGPNGAGKTTIVDVVTGLTKATEGSVLFEGAELLGMAEHKIVRSGIGRSFQKATVFAALSVIENLDLAATFRAPYHSLFRRRRGVSQAVADTLERVGLTEVARCPAGVLAHGQKQWLEIGMLLVQQPRLLLLDEPVAGMSPQERADTGALLQSLAGDHTIVVIEHDMAFLRAFARGVTVLHEGKILFEGSVEQVQGNPLVQEVYLGRARDARSGAFVEPVDPVESVQAGVAADEVVS
jgi:urea transport system ATP-binding protein